MKKILYAVMSFVAVASLAGCNADTKLDEVDLGYLALEESDVNFDWKGGSGQIVVETKSTVTATLAADGTWATASVAGNVVTVTAPEHTGIETRNSSLTLTADGRSVVVPISQTSTRINIAEDDVAVNSLETGNALQGERIFHFFPQNTAAGSVIAVSSEEWISATIDPVDGVVTVNTPRNDAPEPRTGKIYLKYGSQIDSIVVKQSGAEIVIEKALVPMDGKGGNAEVAFDVTGSVPLTATSSDMSWVTVTFDNTTKKVSFTTKELVASASRSAKITLNSGTNLTTTFTVTQTEPVTVKAWADVLFSHQGRVFTKPPTNIPLTLYKSETSNMFYFDSVHEDGFSYVFEWDIDAKSTEIYPHGTNDLYQGVIPLVNQNTGIEYDDESYIWWSSVPMLSEYVPEQQQIVITSLYEVFMRDGSYLGGFGQAVDTFVIKEFLQGNPWE